MAELEHTQASFWTVTNTSADGFSEAVATHYRVLFIMRGDLLVGVIDQHYNPNEDVFFHFRNYDSRKWAEVPGPISHGAGEHALVILGNYEGVERGSASLSLTAFGRPKGDRREAQFLWEAILDTQEKRCRINEAVNSHLAVDIRDIEDDYCADRLLKTLDGRESDAVHKVADRYMSPLTAWQRVRPDPAQYFGAITFAQHGEDIVLLSISNMIGVENPTYLDIGANHPYHLSNTALLYLRGCRGINVEANPTAVRLFDEARPEDVNLSVGVAPEKGVMKFYMVSENSTLNTFVPKNLDYHRERNPEIQFTKVIDVDVVTLNSIVDDYAGGVFPDILSIDIELMDYAVLSSADFTSSRPKIICVEIGGEMRYVDMLYDRGYHLVYKPFVNAIFVHRDHLRGIAWAIHNLPT